MDVSDLGPAMPDILYIVLKCRFFFSSFPPYQFLLTPTFLFKMPSYPMDCTTFMSKDGPSNPKFRIPGGCLQYLPTRDSHFPYLYSLPTHALIHFTHIKKILIHIVDTSCQARIERAKFDHTLSVPLGPNKLMKEYGTSYFIYLSFNFKTISDNNTILGLLELEPGTILFARPLQDDGIYLEEDDIVESWCLDGYVS